jgi:hypothetical protein
MATGFSLGTACARAAEETKLRRKLCFIAGANALRDNDCIMFNNDNSQ